ncbi:hypothetical protein C8J57DRAFT_1241383 [Mycena rebaudengoi]|nr:hypothetical protein C8J57DRAFT_1241383 [Mycena rebaudengoi]
MIELRDPIAASGWRVDGKDNDSIDGYRRKKDLRHESAPELKNDLTFSHQTSQRSDAGAKLVAAYTTTDLAAEMDLEREAAGVLRPSSIKSLRELSEDPAGRLGPRFGQPFQNLTKIRDLAFSPIIRGPVVREVYTKVARPGPNSNLHASSRVFLRWSSKDGADLPDFQSICGPFPLLHSCSIHVSDFHAALGTPYKLSALRDAPQLRELFLGKGVSIKDIPAELQHLTTLEIHDPVLIVFLECADLLRSFPHLIRFSSSIANRWYPINPLDPPASLQTLCLNYDDAFLAHVTIPGLQRFEYRVYESDNSTTVPTFLSFISRSCCVLQHLVLCATPPHTYCIDLSENSLMQCLHAVPSLTTLRFTAAVIAQRFYRELAAGTLLPNLRELYMCEKPEETYDYAPMMHMLTARQGSCAPAIPLDLFELDLARQPPKSELERTQLDTTFNMMVNVNPVREYPAVQRQLQALIRGGLSLRIKYPGETTWPSTECSITWHGPAEERRFLGII